MKLHTLLASLLLAGPAHAQGFADLRGDVDHATADSVAVSWRARPSDSREQTVAVGLDKHGHFRLQVPLTGPTTARLIHGNTDLPLFLEPGDALRLHFRADKPAESLAFRADEPAAKPAAAANNYLTAFETEFADNEGYQVLPENIQLYEKPFLSFLDYRRSQQRALLRRHEARFSPAFAAYAQAEIDYAYANDRLTYPTLREQVVAGEAGPALSPTYYDFMHDPALVPGISATPLSAECQEFMLSYLHHELAASGIAPTAPGYYPACYQLARRQLGGPLRLAVLSQVLAETFRFGSAVHAPALLADFATLAPPAWVAALGQDWTAHATRAVGAPAPPLPLHTATGDTVRLAAYTGRMVYVMFWDSRQALGQREMPYLKEVTATFAGQPVAFVTAALDPDSAAWTRNVGALPVAATHAWVPARQQAAVQAAYGIEQLPAFVLLDEQGRILNSRPKRPSSRALLDELRASPGKGAAYQTVPLPGR